MKITSGGNMDGAKGEQGPPSLGGSSASFFTPQHFPASVRNSTGDVCLQDSCMDVYHDAYSTLGRISRGSPDHYPLTSRRRHASTGAQRESGVTPKLDFKRNDSTYAPSKGPAARVRHASCHAGLRSSSGCNSPSFVVDLSHSTASLKKLQEKEWEGNPSTKTTNNSVAGVPNYVPCAELDVKEESVKDKVDQSAAGNKDKMASEGGLIGNDSAAWSKNYIASVETERLLGLDYVVVEPADPETSAKLEIKIVKGKRVDDPVVHTYTFDQTNQKSRGFQCIRDEFKATNFGLSHKAPHLFVTSQWQDRNRLSCLYLGYRIFVALHFLTWACWSLAGSHGYEAPLWKKRYYFLYMTNWGIWLLAVDTMLQAVNIVCHSKKLSVDGDCHYFKMKTLHKVSWVLSNITGSLHLFITVAYWITVYPMRSGELGVYHVMPDENLSVIGLNTHLVPGIYVIVDCMVSATPRQLLHSFQPMGFLMVYTMFNLIYYISGGKDYVGRSALYPILDWTKPLTTSAIMGSVIIFLIPALHTVICCLYALRLKMWRIHNISRYEQQEREDEILKHLNHENNV